MRDQPKFAVSVLEYADGRIGDAGHMVALVWYFREEGVAERGEAFRKSDHPKKHLEDVAAALRIR